MFDKKELNEKYPTLAKFSAPLQSAEREIVGRDREIGQLMAAMSRPELCNALLLAPPGSGKALENGTMIPVADDRGYVAIEKLVAGKDRVFDEEGFEQLVEGVFPQGKKRAFRLTLEDGSSLVLNDEHLMNARRIGEGDKEAEAARIRFAEASEAHRAEQTEETHTALRLALRDLWSHHRTVTVREIIDSGDGSGWVIPSGLGVQRSMHGYVLDDHLRDQSRQHTLEEAMREAMMLRVEDRLAFTTRAARPDPRSGWVFSHDKAFVDHVRQLLASAGVRADTGRFVDSHGEGLRLRPRRELVPELKIASIHDLGMDVEMTCIKVSGDSSLFQAGYDHVVTHNTALVQAAMLKDDKRTYMEVDLARMIADLSTPDEMAALLKTLFDEAEQYSRGESEELVLFIDEFHQVVQLSAAAVEALKPVLAASGARGIRVIAATTDDEFDKHVKPNQPLVERLQRIVVNPPDRDTTVKIMRGMAERYGVDDQFYDDHVFEMIYEYTERYVPASTQPRKSILVLDSMVGWHKYTGRPMDRALLADVLMESLSVNVAFRVNATKIKEDLDRKVFSQHLATATVAKRLQLVVADLHDKSRPASSFLFAGSTGVGKTELVKQLANLLFGDARKHLIRFDMTEYARDDSLDVFRTELTSKVWHTSHAVVLFDEIEKASPMVTRMLLQVLDDGRLSDATGRQVSFLNTYIVLTTNAGSEIFETIAQYNVDDTGSGEQLETRMKEIRRSITTTQGDNRFPPELLGRIDALVPFQPLSRATQTQIVTEKLRKFRREVMQKHGVKLMVDPAVIEYLIEDKGDTDSNAGGARAAIQKLTDEVATKVAAFINEQPGHKALQVDVVGKMRSGDKSTLRGDAYVDVRLPPRG